MRGIGLGIQQGTSQPVPSLDRLLYGMLREGCNVNHRRRPTLKEKGWSENPHPHSSQSGTFPSSTLLCLGNIATPPWETKAPSSPNQQARDGIPDARETTDTSTQGPLKKSEAYSSSWMGLCREAKQLLGLPGLCLQAVVSSVCPVPQLMTGR